MVPKTGGFFVTGGIKTNSNKNEEEISKTSEVFRNGKWIEGPELPTPISHHCLVQLDDTRLVKKNIFGEHQNASKYKSSVSFYNKAILCHIRIK